MRRWFNTLQEALETLPEHLQDPDYVSSDPEYGFYINDEGVQALTEMSE